MKKIIALAMVCASLLPAVARAEGHEGGHMEGHTEGHAESYIGLSASKLASGSKTAGNTPSTGAALMLGHRYSEHLAVELAYADNGMVTAADERTTAVSAAVIGMIPINAALEAYGRIGYASATTKAALAGVSAKHNDITYGVGVEYRLSEKYSLSLGWDRVQIGDSSVVELPRANEDAYALMFMTRF